MLNDRAEFSPLRPRRITAHNIEAPGRPTEPPSPAQEAPHAELALAEPAPMEPLLDPQLTEVAIGGSDDEPHHESNSPRASGQERFASMLRDEAIRFASIAAARALRASLVDESTIARYVDDALRACGRFERVTVRLHPADAAAYRPQRAIDVIADSERERGEVVIDLPCGCLSATLEERAALLVRAAAC